ncbi:hypothetical protein HPB49_002877 [Dermacentor silvarum]|uniref:Uncharacterized protein n=1 Tax=Dermacentor silvarum TaxID=543639 RepID=A0ACB8DA67_DERSI|nr:hypothetical protein HPB49_002877 [Dermacentor silvarum]
MEANLYSEKYILLSYFVNTVWETRKLPRQNHHSSYRHCREETEHHQRCTALNRCPEYTISTVSSKDGHFITEKDRYVQLPRLAKSRADNKRALPAIEAHQCLHKRRHDECADAGAAHGDACGEGATPVKVRCHAHDGREERETEASACRGEQTSAGFKI